MNDATNLAFYTQLLQYKMNPSLPETMFKDPNNSQQRTLHSLAHAMGLEYEYSIMTRTVIITRQTQSTKTIFTEDRAFDFNEFIDFGPSKASDILWNDSCGFPIAMSSPSTHPGYNSSPMYRPVTPSGQMHVPNSTTIKILGRKDQGSASFSGPESVMSDAGSIDVSAMDPNLDLVFSVSPPSSETITWGSQSLLGLYGQSNRVSDKPPSPPTDTIKSPKIFNFLCSFEGCARGIPGSGFPRYWNLRDHVKRVHNSSPSPQSKYIDEINSSVGHASNHNGDAKGSSRYTSYMTRLATGNSYPTYSSADEVMFTSPMDVMPQAVLESSITHDDVSAAIDPMNINDSLWAWDEVGQPESGGSASFFPDMAWLTGVATKNPMNYSPNRAVNSLRYVATHSIDPYLLHTYHFARVSRMAMDQHNGCVHGDHSSNYYLGFYNSLHQTDRSYSHGSVDNDNTPRDHPLYQKATTDPDGLYHCPWEGKDPSCNHMPEKLKCNYE
jgi:hypothetical protein